MVSNQFLRFWVVTAVDINSMVFCDVTLCSSVDDCLRFMGISALHPHI
jgi:hypothetical protein